MKKRTYQQYYADIAQAIRNKGGSGYFSPAQMASAIRNLQVSGLGTVTPFPSSGGYKRDAMTDPANYTAIANAIRTKAGTTAKYTPSQMAAVIQALKPIPVPNIRLQSNGNYSWMGLLVNGNLIGSGTAKSLITGLVSVDLTNIAPGTWDVYAGRSASSNRCIGSVTIPFPYTQTSMTFTV